MDEGAADQERQPVISDLFPLGEKSVLTAFQEIYPHAGSFVEDVVSNEREILRRTNPYVLNSLEQLIDAYTEENAKLMLEGALICHRALRREFKIKSGILPSLTEDFVRNYDEEKQGIADRRIDEDITHRERVQAGEELRKMRIFRFRQLEPVFSRIVEEKLGDQPKWVPENDYRYRGIIDQYLIFREGLSNPKNFQQ